jgi:hypothetical protein
MSTVHAASARRCSHADPRFQSDTLSWLQYWRVNRPSSSAFHTASGCAAM